MDSGRKKIVVITENYPSQDLPYGDGFVHARAKEYLKNFDVYAFGYTPHAEDIQYTYEGISVRKTQNLQEFRAGISTIDPDAILVHFIHFDFADFLLSIGKPLIIFLHGFEATSWRRRIMNYDTIGSLRYLIPYMLKNTRQLYKLKQLVKRVSHLKHIRFVFVSEWLKSAVEKDLGIKIYYSHVIPNGIDTALFSLQSKTPEHRTKVLLLRSFRAVNYANDIAVKAIQLLSRFPFFQDFTFAIYGEGYLFKKVTEPIRHFPNVELHNYFIENKNIPELHRNFGIFLCPSRLDSQGVSMCEAMSSGLVPIASPIGGIPEYNWHGYSGFNVTSPEQIAEKIAYLYNNPAKFHQMSEQAHKTIVETCSIEKTVLEERKLIEDVIRGADGYQQCTRCILDTKDDAEITFDKHGICSHCRTYERQSEAFKQMLTQSGKTLEKIVSEIKTRGKEKKYDCIIGVSGGVDSTYLAWQAKKLGLRPLAVHFDNGWNSELAVNNIEKIINTLGFELHTFIVDWEEFRDLQLAFLKASVVDIELVTDHAIITQLYKLAIKYDINYIISGTNLVTESILPSGWIHDKKDHIHVRAINEVFGTRPLKTYPLFDSFLKWRVAWRGIQSIPLLDYLDYNKKKAVETITRELGWRDYGGKHYESIFTRFFQGYILPVKFGIDKRKAHLSNLICSGQISRDEALLEISNPPYKPEVFKSDYEFVLKKLGLSQTAFEDIMRIPVKKHIDYPTDRSIYERFSVLRLVAPVWRFIKTLKFRQSL